MLSHFQWKSSIYVTPLPFSPVQFQYNCYFTKETNGNKHRNLMRYKILYYRSLPSITYTKIWDKINIWTWNWTLHFLVWQWWLLATCLLLFRRALFFTFRHSDAAQSKCNCQNWDYYFFIHLTLEFLPVSGPLTRWCARVGVIIDHDVIVIFPLGRFF